MLKNKDEDNKFGRIHIFGMVQENGEDKLMLEYGCQDLSTLEECKQLTQQGNWVEVDSNGTESKIDWDLIWNTCKSNGYIS
jgi:hypothetical protein